WKLGCATLRFNFRGVGASEGDYAGGEGEADDARAAARLLLSQKGIAGEGFIMAGYSFGAAVAMRAGVSMREVATIVAIALPVAMGDFSDAAKSGKRIVLVCGDADGYSPESKITKLAQELGSSAKLRLISGADHFFGGEEDSLTSALVELLKDG